MVKGICEPRCTRLLVSRRSQRQDMTDGKKGMCKQMGSVKSTYVTCCLVRIVKLPNASLHQAGLVQLTLNCAFKRDYPSTISHSLPDTIRKQEEGFDVWKKGRGIPLETFSFGFCKRLPTFCCHDLADVICCSHNCIVPPVYIQNYNPSFLID